MYKIIEESNDLFLTHIRDESSFFFFYHFSFLAKNRNYEGKRMEGIRSDR